MRARITRAALVAASVVAVAMAAPFSRLGDFLDQVQLSSAPASFYLKRCAQKALSVVVLMY